MAYHLKPGESVARGLKRIARAQLNKALEELDDPTLDAHTTIHQVRKRCKKLRALVRLVRGVVPGLYARENAFFRDAARSISDLRDAEVFLETYDALMAHSEGDVDRRAFGPIRGALTRRRARLTEHLDLDGRLTAFRRKMVIARGRVRNWSFPAAGYDVVRGGFKKTYARGRKGLQRAYADPSDEAFHEWRKRVKYHLYHLGMLRDLWEPVITARYDQLYVLSELLGDDHNLAALRQVIADEPETFGRLQSLQAFLGLLDRRRGELQALARPLGLRAFAEKPGALADRFGAYWAAWDAEAPKKARRAAPRTPVTA